MWNISDPFWYVAVPAWSLVFLFWLFGRIVRKPWGIVLPLLQAGVCYFPYHQGRPVSLGLVHSQAVGIFSVPLHLAGAGFVFLVFLITKRGTTQWGKDEKFFYKSGQFGLIMIAAMQLAMNTDNGRPPDWAAGFLPYLGFVCLALGGPSADINETYSSKSRWVMYLMWLPLIAALLTT